MFTNYFWHRDTLFAIDYDKTFLIGLEPAMWFP